MYGTSFTVPTGKRVLEVVFANDKDKMYSYACEYVEEIGGPYFLGIEFREIVKKVNRTSWWKGCKIWMEREIMSN